MKNENHLTASGIYPGTLWLCRRNGKYMDVSYQSLFYMEADLF